MDKYLTDAVQSFAEGSVVKGVVIDVRPNDVLVDIGYKSEGLIPKYEFMHPETLVVGSEIEVLLEKIEDENGMVVLSYEKAEQKKNWDRIVLLCNEGGTIDGVVRSKVKGGLTVNIGVEAFLPASQIDVIPPRNLDEYVGKTYKFKVVKINQERKNIVLSRRELIESERDDRRRALLGEMKVGEIREGIVKNLTDFGAFVEVEEGVDGMAHISDMSWTRKVTNPTEIVKKGQVVEAVVLEVDAANQRLSLGLKQLTEDPWRNIDQHFRMGDLVKGKVVKLTSFGAFVELAGGLEGLVHISQIREERVEKMKDVLKAGDEVSARVIKIDAGERRIGLSIKAANYSSDQLEAEKRMFEDALKPGEAIVDLEHAFEQAQDEKNQ